MKHILSIALLISSAAGGATELKDRARQEKTWMATEIFLTESPQQLVGTGYITKDQNWRIDRLSATVEVGVPLSSQKAAEIGADRFLKLCRKMGFGFIASREQQTSHKILLRLPNLSLAPVGDLQLSAEIGKPILSLPQNPFRIIQARARITFSDQANTLLYSNLDPKVIERLFEGQGLNQLQKLRSEGLMEIDIKGHDYVACDFAQGLAQVGIELDVEYPSAKLGRQSTVSTAALQQLLNSAKAAPLDGSCDNRVRLASGYLGVALNQILKTSIIDLSNGTFLTILNALYDSQSCQWRATNPDLGQLAEEFDTLSPKMTRSTIVFKSRFNGEVIQ